MGQPPTSTDSLLLAPFGATNLSKANNAKSNDSVRMALACEFNCIVQNRNQSHRFFITDYAVLIFVYKLERSLIAQFYDVFACGCPATHRPSMHNVSRGSCIS